MVVALKPEMRIVLRSNKRPSKVSARQQQAAQPETDIVLSRPVAGCRSLPQVIMIRVWVTATHAALLEARRLCFDYSFD
jgi:hypothetical protein